MWSKKPDKIKRQITYLDYIDGGLRVPNISTTFKAIKLAYGGAGKRVLEFPANCSEVFEVHLLKMTGQMPFKLDFNLPTFSFT